MGVSHLHLRPSSVCLSRRLWLKTVWVLAIQRFIAKSLLVFSAVLGIFLWHYPNWVSAHLFRLFSIGDVNNLSCFEVCKFVGPSSTLPRRALEQLLFSPEKWFTEFSKSSDADTSHFKTSMFVLHEWVLDWRVHLCTTCMPKDASAYWHGGIGSSWVVNQHCGFRELN